jgi:16S rRNA (uracil1498-N3)-methyltransferase
MRRRFFVDEVRNGHAEIEGDDARHLTRVLRVEVGQRYEISDNRNVYLAEIETARKEHVVFRTLEKMEVPPPGPRVILCAALIKFDHFEWMIEKATELGVSEIVPVQTARSEHGLERAAGKRIERWRRIAVEASQQSRRAFLPEIAEPVKLAAALAIQASQRIVFDEESSRRLEIAPGFESIALMVGPEGGWTDEERSEFGEWQAVSMGPLILRAETAAISALAIAGWAWQAGHGAESPMNRLLD